ncbi:RagB/SusD family nutrient uptake outer membrane protein [Cytophagaceae bacterium DM2B3-1]|uniref:RagB/SusD family nutrient uptake outer membrane protein n=1 Tax=Xanthocytophaga flava TaxID=3048013 RepID=A0ABT7CI76_9BACT|nr:RagB/SusD family nutrient uptake outer membrane protein [Xanthocytophaga flavus]MDJ1493443.1 RagB/SusD family nutrient uptake outer membrane protein [Xanthocytophaga flavus]
MSSCNNKLDVTPIQEIDETNALTTSPAVIAALTGAYDGLQSDDTYAGAISYTADLVGDDREVVFAGTFSSLDELWRKTIATTNTQVRDTWLGCYDVINRVNNVLEALPIVVEDERARVEGEALFIRAAMHFELVRLFAKSWNDGNPAQNPGVPIILTATHVPLDETDYPARATVAEVYAQVISDLTKAESLLEDASGGSTLANKQVVTAMLSRVYLMQGNYTAARDAANAVIESEAYTLLSDFTEAFNNYEIFGGTPTAENIFSIKVTNQDGVNGLNTFFVSSGYGGRGDIRVQQKHLQLYEENDVRGTFFYTSSNRVFTEKYTDQYGNVPIIRFAEMYLTRAEANFRLGESVGAAPVDDINVIRERAGLNPLATVNLSQILKERKLELAFEGHLLHDLKRTEQSVGDLPFNANELVLPIPQRERDTNKNLTQNPGYAQ